MSLIDQVKPLVLSELANRGFNYSDQDDTSVLLRRYLNLKSKLIEPKQRAVWQSKQLLAHKIPTPFKEAVHVIREKLEKGIDVNCHLSKDALDPDKPDFLLYDWSIHHIHASNTKADLQDYYFTRSNYLLFAQIFDNQAFLIDILPHKDKNVFAKKHLLSVIQSNWPHLLAPHELKDVIAIEHNPSDEEIDQLRRAGVNFPIELNGKFYAVLGGGLTTARTSTAHQIEINNLIHWLKSIEKYLATDAATIIEKINAIRNLHLTELRPSVRMVGDKFVVIESQSDVVIG